MPRALRDEDRVMGEKPAKDQITRQVPPETSFQGSSPGPPSSILDPRSSILNPRSLRLPTLSGPVLGLIAVLTLFILLFGARGDLGQFLSLRNLQVLVHGDTITAVAALGMLLIIISGGIDLSTGSVVALVTVVTMQVYRRTFDQTDSMTSASLLAVSAGISVGGVAGLVNGLII